MPFVEAEFPKTISAKAMGGPAFNTTVNEGFSGFEQRNQNWEIVRGDWNIALETPSPNFVATPQEYIDQLTAFFLVVGGRFSGFRLKDHKDFTSGASNQFLGVGDGVTSIFQLVKVYSAAGLSYSRTIFKPMTSLVVDYLGNSLLDTVAVYLGAVLQAANPGYVGGGSAQYTLDETQGIICFGGYSVWSITAVSVSGTTATYAYGVTSGNAPQKNQVATFAGMTHSANDGPFQITSVSPSSPTAGTFTVTNPIAAAESGSTGTGTVSASKVAITAVLQSGSNTTYTYTLTSGQALAQGMRVTIISLAAPGNNGTFYITLLGSGTFTVVNPSGVTATSQAGTGFTDWTPAVNAQLTDKFNYHFPVRFDTDKLNIQLEESNVQGEQPIISWNAIVLKELRLIGGQG